MSGMKNHTYLSARCLVADFLYRFSGAPVKELVEADIERNLSGIKRSTEDPYGPG